MLGAGFVADQHTFADYVKTFGFADELNNFISAIASIWLLPSSARTNSHAFLLE